MKITIEVQEAATDIPIGIPHYTIHLARTLIKRGRNDYSLSFFDYNRDRGNINYINKHFGDLNPQLFECNSIKHNFLYSDLAYREKSYNDYTGSNADVFHFPTILSIPSSINGKIVVTLHDLTSILPYYGILPFDIPAQADVSFNLERIRQKRTIVIAVSQAAKNDMIEYLGIPEEIIFIVPNGVDHDIIFPEKDSSVLHQLGVRPPYYLALGSIDHPRKNTRGLIDAFERLAQKNADVQLVLSGNCTSEKMRSFISNSRFSDRIIVTGFISERQRRVLLSDAIALVYPSLYEGFGLPIVEAMACGAPVITSNTSSMPEVAGDVGILIDPNDSEQLAFEMERVLNSAQLREELAKKGLVHSAQYTWDKTAEETERVYQLAAEY